MKVSMSNVQAVRSMVLMIYMPELRNLASKYMFEMWAESSISKVFVGVCTTSTKKSLKHFDLVS